MASGDRNSPTDYARAKQRVCFADGVHPGSAVIEDPPVSKYDVIRKNAARKRLAAYKQEIESSNSAAKLNGDNDEECDER